MGLSSKQGFQIGQLTKRPWFEIWTVVQDLWWLETVQRSVEGASGPKSPRCGTIGHLRLLHSELKLGFSADVLCLCAFSLGGGFWKEYMMVQIIIWVPT